MTVRPRYTARMKARDLAAAYGTVWKVMAPLLAGVAARTDASTLHVLTARYTDPEGHR